MGIRVGCGSWSDDAYREILYPPGTPSAARLHWYAEHFDHVEVNSSYYAVPRREATAKWVKQTSAGFLFDIKLHRAFSQSPEKTAKEGKQVRLLMQGIEPLIRARKLGVFLLVLDPRFGPEKHGLEELDALAKALHPHLLAVELRHAGWVKGKRKAETFEFFRERKLVWVAVDMPRIAGSNLLPPLYEVSNPDLAYVRLHGRNPNYLEAKSADERHAYLYRPSQIRSLARHIRGLAVKAADVRVVANNHHEDFAPRTAMALAKVLA
ncbi:Uncharacterized conserved protein YecE, DUF72 family [Verrucomicrobium sp. GAS474]|uniref:DUF72 domain-containing protein n=1 Tax=Verrucomicrobium sp. GAS474 TaxID=1882831 RepID=UPI00087C9BD1|nr:DUF72 domain-containing protein [Verrucomicrobium sp. GAS474]SDU12190.1 Uncharacterized conserved protein YecE, DUF72 family [Verrucomicrobium sp. GAS474]